MRTIESLFHKISILKGDGLKARAIRSTLLTGFTFGSENLLRLISNLILTRLLFPEAFGLMALVQVFLIGLNMFSDLGIRAAIIQDRKSDQELYLNTAWTLQIMRGVILWIATWIIAQPMADFYNEPLLAQMMPVAGLAALFQGFNSTKMATADRDLQMGKLTVVTFATQVIGLIVMVILSYKLQSVWALVIGGPVAPLLMAIFSHVALPGQNNRLALDPAAARRLIGFGKYIFLGSIAGFVIQFGDRAILGKIVTFEELGLYNIAFYLATIPFILNRKLIDKVLFPLYRWSPPSESAENWRKISRARMMLTGAMLPLTAILAFGGNFLVEALYDPRYAVSGQILILVVLAHIAPMLTENYSVIALANGDSGRFALMTTFAAVLRTGLVLLGGIYFGLVGVILAPIVATILYYPAMIWFIWKYKAWDYRHDLLFTITGILIAVAVYWMHGDHLAAVFGRFATGG